MGSLDKPQEIPTPPSEKTEYKFKIDKEFLEKSLEKKIKSFQVSSGSSPGDNYLSVLYGIRVELDEEPKLLHLMLKVYPGHFARHAMLNHFNLFHLEVGVYAKLLPTLMSWQQTQGCNFKLPFPGFVDGFGQDHWNSPDAELKDNFLLMIDMKKTHGYKMANRLQGLDLEHAKCVLTSLARFHAIGWGYQSGLNVSRKEFLESHAASGCAGGFFNEKGEGVIMQFLNANTAMLLPIMEEIFGGEGDIFRNLKAFLEGTDMSKLMKYSDPKGGEGIDEDDIEDMLRIKPGTPIECRDAWNVITHGDCWLNNFLFKYDEQTKSPVDAIMVDLQGSNLGCPTLDLCYFVYTSIGTDTRREHLSDLLSFYAKEFIRICSELSVDLPSGFCERTLERRFHRSKQLGLIFAVIVLPIIMAEECDDLDQAEIKEGSNDMDFLKDTIAGKKAGKDSPIVRRLKEMVEDLYEEGVF